MPTLAQQLKGCAPMEDYSNIVSSWLRLETAKGSAASPINAQLF